MSPFTVSCTVPSPPTATTAGQPSRAAASASSAACPRRAVCTTVCAAPARAISASTSARTRAAAPFPAAGFTIT